MERMEYQREDEGLQSLTGTVERVVFRNEENGWTVLELEAGEGALVIRNATGMESFVCDGECEDCPFMVDDCDGNCDDCPCQSACDRVNGEGIDE